MLIRPILALGVAAALMPTALMAQPLPQSDRPVMVTVHMSTTLPIGSGGDDAAIQKQAREAFYKTAAGECALISQSLPGDCALLQVNINTRRMEPRILGSQVSEPTVSIEGNMSFSVTPSATPTGQ